MNPYKSLILQNTSYYMKYNTVSYQKYLFFIPILLLILSCREQAENKTIDHKFTNLLVEETSPYLLQHAHNPVNWRPWSEAALSEAKKENKLVLVSIGYSSCHWCHVMEEETFEDEAVAKLMNDNFISIKVDREERPDVDHIYQTALELVEGSGGWPLNAITLANGKPIYLGTYHSKEQWIQVLSKFSERYSQDAEKMEEYADMLAQGIQDQNLIQPATDFKELTKDAVKESVMNWKPNWDLEWGGDKGDVKFMLPVNLNFLLDYAQLTGDDLTKAHVKNTLDKMLMGGVYDHLGGGFFRYSTDPQWKVPHFEKMLYDSAQLLSLYAKAYTIYKDQRYKNVVMEITAFLDREMKNPEGGYFSAIDADSEGEEGKFYLWKAEELKSILKGEFILFSKYYNIQADKVWEEGNYVLHTLVSDKDFAKKNNITLTKLQVAKTKWKKALLNVRDERVRPSIDDKIITSWNALLINGFVDAYKAFGQKEFLDRAASIYVFLKEKSFSSGQLIHSYKQGSKVKDGFLEDYTFLVSASLNLYGVTLKEGYFDFANELNQLAEDKFSDDTSGMYRYSENQELISKIIETNDGFWPSPNAVMAHNLFRLGHISYEPVFVNKSKAMLSTMIPLSKAHAANYSKWNSLLLHNTYPFFEIAVVGERAEELVQSLNRTYITNALVIGSTTESNSPLFKGRFTEEGTYIYVCQNSTCKLPVETVDEAKLQLKNF